MATELVLFTPANGGLGATLTCTGSSTRVALPDPTDGSVWAVNVTGLDYVYLFFGTSTAVSTLACMAFAPGVSYVGIPNAGGSGAPTHVAGISGGTSIPVQITAGSLGSPV